MAKTRRLLAVVAVLFVVGVVPALADTRNVSADCGGNGLFRSTGNVWNHQTHTKGGVPVFYSYGDMAATRITTWGWYSGTQWATLTSGFPFNSASANCPS